VENVVPLSVSRLLGLVSAGPSLVSPNGDGRRDRLTVSFGLSAAANVRVRMLRDGRWVATPLSGLLQAGPQTVTWDGTRSEGRLRDGSYEVVVEATNEVSAASYAVPFAVDTTPPAIRVVSVRPLRLEVSEPAIVKLTVDGVPLRRRVRHAGRIQIRLQRPLRRARIVAWDEAGNVSVPLLVAQQLVKKPGQ
jgi:hypothetical protein